MQCTGGFCLGLHSAQSANRGYATFSWTGYRGFSRVQSWDSNLEIWTSRAANRLRLLQVSLLKKAKEEQNTWYNEHEQCEVDGILYNSKGYMWKQWLEDVMDGWKNALFKIL